MFNFIKDFFKPKKMVHVQIEPSSVRENNTIRALANENAELKGENAKIRSELGKLREQETDKKEDEEVRYYLDKEKKQIRAKSQGKFFSFKSLFLEMLKSNGNNALARNLNIVTFDRSTKIGKFGDFGISDDGAFVILDSKQNIIMKMQNLKDMFQSVSALGNDVESKMIPVNLSKDGVFVENIMDWQSPELIVMGTKMRYAKASKKPVYEVISNLNAEISSLRVQLEEAEMMNIELQKKGDEQERDVKINEAMAQTTRAELSKVEERTIGVDKVFRDIEKDLVHHRNLHVIHEDTIGKMGAQIHKLLSEAERAGSTTSFDDAIEKLEAAKEVLK